MIDADRFERALLAFIEAHHELLASVGESREASDEIARAFLAALRVRIGALREDGARGLPN